MLCPWSRCRDDPILWFEGSSTVNINTYDDWGIPAPGNIAQFGYTGQVWLDELGLSYYKARFYSPTLGRFMQTDPIGYDADMNIYAYVGNDSVNFLDSTGNQPEAVMDRRVGNADSVIIHISIFPELSKYFKRTMNIRSSGCKRLC